MELIDKAAVVAEIETRYNNCLKRARIVDAEYWNGKADAYRDIWVVLDTLEVRDPYERCVQYQSVEAGIKAHAEIYSFNTDSELFPQLTKEQQKLWRKEIEYACISGGDMGYILAKDPRYKENHEVKEMNLEKYLKESIEDIFFDLDGVAVKGTTHYITVEDVKYIAKNFFELGLKAQKGE